MARRSSNRRTAKRQSRNKARKTRSASKRANRQRGGGVLLEDDQITTLKKMIEHKLTEYIITYSNERRNFIHENLIQLSTLILNKIASSPAINTYEEAEASVNFTSAAVMLSSVLTE